MIVIRWTAPSELDVSGSPSELRAVKTRILDFAAGAEAHTLIHADSDADPAPYSKSLEILRVAKGVGPTRISVDGTVMNVTGSQKHLEVFAKNFDFSDDSPSRNHVHYEFYAGNQWIAPDSVPLVVSVR